MEAIQTIEEKDVTTAIFQFIFPFSFKTGYEQNMFPFLQKNDFRPFRLDHLENEKYILWKVSSFTSKYGSILSFIYK